MPDQSEKTKLQHGGLQGKIFRLCIMLVVTASICFAMLGIRELRDLENSATKSGQLQSDTVQEMSEASLMEMTDKNMQKFAILTSNNVFWEIWIMEHDAISLSNQVWDVINHPDQYEERDVFPPDKANEGELVLQLLMADGIEPTEEEMVLARKLANLEPLMRQMIRDNNYCTLDLLIALPSGITLDMDPLSQIKVDAQGNPVPFDARQRPWYKGAVETQDFYLVPPTYSDLLGEADLEFGVPLFKDGELLAIVEGSIRMATVTNALGKMEYGESGFFILVSEDGTLIYSPKEEGSLKMDLTYHTNIADLGIPKLVELLEKTFDDQEGFDNIVVDGEEYYVAYGNGVSDQWATFLFVSRQELEKPTKDLTDSMDETTEATLRDYQKIFFRSALTILIITAAMLLITLIAAFLFSRRITNPINRMTEKVRSISGDSFNFEMDEHYRTGDEIEVLAGTFEELSDRTRKYITEITEFTAEKERIGAELNVATRIQASMLPKNFPIFPDRKEFELYATMTPAKEVAGDFYDMFLIDDDHLCMVVGDVSGKGVPAALFMVVSKTVIKNRALSGGTPAEILYDVNNSLNEGNTEIMFVTVWLGILTISTGELVQASAGHEYPVIQRKGGDYELITTDNGMILGVIKKAKYKNITFNLGVGDTLFMYTDGLPEATNAMDKRLEIDGMMAAINRHKDADVQELLKCIRQEVNDFVKGAPQYDDLTMLILRYYGSQPKI